MRRRLRAFVVTLMLAAIVLGGQSAGYVGPAAQTAPPAIRLRAGTIVPGVQETIPGTEANKTIVVTEEG